MPDILRRVVVQVRAPSDTDPGQVTDGYYTIEDGKLTMTDPMGEPVRRDDGSLFEQRLAPAATPRAVTGVAAKLTREVRRHLLGLSPTQEAFCRPIGAGKMGLA